MNNKKYKKKLNKEAEECERAANSGILYAESPEQLRRQAAELRKMASEN